MITENTIEGVRFISDIKILEADDKIGGIPVHRISERLTLEAPELITAIKALGLRKVGRDYRYPIDLYAESQFSYLRIKVIQIILRIYWKSLRWLYDNIRMFKQIPESQPFSWRYFTPYIWYKEILKRN